MDSDDRKRRLDLAVQVAEWCRTKLALEVKHPISKSDRTALRLTHSIAECEIEGLRTELKRHQPRPAIQTRPPSPELA